MTDAEVEAKFRSLAERYMDAEKLKQIVEMVFNLEKLKDIGELNRRMVVNKSGEQR